MWIRAAIAALALGLCTGCYALDLIDEGQEEMERYSAKTKKEREAEAQTPASAPATGTAKPAEDAARWWSGARSLTPGQTSQGIVRCQIGGSVQFTSRTDCQTRGGRVGG